MNKDTLLLMLDELLELSPGTLNGDELLSNLKWDSLSVIGFIALCDERFAVAVSPREVCKGETIQDLLTLLGNKIKSETTVKA